MVTDIKIAILGYGIEGNSALKFLRKQFKTARTEVRDIKIQGKNYLKGLENFDLIVRSPGIPYLSPEIQKAKKAGVEVSSATKLFFEFAVRRGKGILVSITGTKGKGTTATLLYKILKASGKDAHLIGNMGIPMLDELPKLKKNSISILELSSFQLQDLDVSPHIAAILDISPDHLNYHKNFKEYLDAKSQIIKHKLTLPVSPALNPLYGGSDARTRSGKRSLFAQVFFSPDNKYSKQIAQKSKGWKFPVLADKSLKLKIPGVHNVKNASMAAAVARALGAPGNIIRQTIRNFKGLPHRLEFVKEINGIKFYNDSASTNPAATVAALKAFREPKILIAGGAGKGLNYDPLKSAVKNSNTKLVILYGKNKNQIGGAVGSAARTIMTQDLKTAVKIAFQKAQRGDIVLLSPASASFDFFGGYAARGEAFKKEINLTRS